MFQIPGFSALVRRYLCALGLTALALGVRLLIDPVANDYFPFIFFLAAALAASAYKGLGPGFAALVVGYLLGDFFFIQPRGSIGAYNSPAIRELIYYFCTGIIGIVLIEGLNRDRKRAENAAEKLRREVARRELTEAKLLDAQAQLSRHADDLELRVAERTAELEHSVHSMEALLYHIAHNLRAPLRSMEGFATLLHLEYATELDEPGRAYTERIGRAARRMDQLIRDLLDFGRVSHDNFGSIPVSLDRSLAVVLARMESTIEATQANVQITDARLMVRADEQLLKEVLFKVVENGLKFIRPGVRPRLTIWTERENAHVRLWVQDNGIGIKPEYRDRIFGVFEQLNGDAYEGTGIGLAIVKEAMRRMGGSVGFESNGITGSSFWIELAAANQP